MIRSILAVILLVGAVLWAPLWFQCVLFVVCIAFLPKKVLFLIPAIISDALYAPTSGVSIATFKMTMIVIAMLLVWLALMQQTRISHVVPTK